MTPMFGLFGASQRHSTDTQWKWLWGQGPRRRKRSSPACPLARRAGAHSRDCSARRWRNTDAKYLGRSHIGVFRSSTRWKFNREAADSGHSDHPTMGKGHPTEQRTCAWATCYVDGWVNHSLRLLSPKHSNNSDWYRVLEPKEATSTTSDSTSWCVDGAPQPWTRWSTVRQCA